MNSAKKHIIEHIRRESLAEAAHLAGDFARAASRDREAILAEMEFEQWLADTCDVCLD